MFLFFPLLLLPLLLHHHHHHYHHHHHSRHHQGISRGSEVTDKRKQLLGATSSRLFFSHRAPCPGVEPMALKCRRDDLRSKHQILRTGRQS